ncbi:MAG: hypothetical protein ACOZQL_03615 [Myxococcota bacterium]
MSQAPLPWNRSPDAAPEERAAVEAVKQASAIAPRPVELARTWDQVLERATRPARPSWRTFLTAVAAGVLLVLAGRGLRPTPQQVLLAAPDARWEQRLDGGVQLTRGRLQTTKAAPVALETPQVSVLTSSARFAAEVLVEGTLVTVFEGEVLVRSGADERVLRAGETALWRAAPEIPASLEAHAAEPLASCSGAASGQRVCLERLAEGDSLTAEVAAFELGRLAARGGDEVRALEQWHGSLARWPDGVFAPEVRLALLRTLTHARRFAEAAEVAAAFEQRHPDDPRVPEVRRLREDLERAAR